MSQEMDLAHPLSKAEFFEVFDNEKCNIIPDHHLNLRSQCVVHQFELAYSAFASIK